jgi:hypothetical protein
MTKAKSRRAGRARHSLERYPFRLNNHAFLTFCLRMIFSDLASPAEAGFAKAGNRFPLFGIMR